MKPLLSLNRKPTYSDAKNYHTGKPAEDFYSSILFLLLAYKPGMQISKLTTFTAVWHKCGC